MTTAFDARGLWSLARMANPQPAGDRIIFEEKTADIEADVTRTRIWMSRGGVSEPLTPRGADCTGAALSPSGGSLAFLSKASDLRQVHVQNLSGGESRQIGAFPLGVTKVQWFPNEASLGVLAPLYRDAPTIAATSKRIDEVRAESPRATESHVYRFWDSWLTDGKVPHLFRLDLDGSLQHLTPGFNRWFPFLDPQFDIAPDGAEIAFAADVTDPPHRRPRFAIHVADVNSTSVTCLTPDNPANDTRPRFSPDGATIVFGSKRIYGFYGDRTRLMRMDRETGEVSEIAPGWDESPSEWEFHADGTLAIRAVTGGRSTIFSLRAADSDPQVSAKGATFSQIRPRDDGSLLALRQALDEPPVIAEVNGKTLIDRNQDILDSIELGSVQEMTVTGADGHEVQMFVVFPAGFDPGRKWPLVQMIHGGPHGAFGDTFHYRWNAQTLAAPGYVVAMVNFHGSEGFGSDFTASILGEWGHKPSLDIEAATDHLVGLGYVDESRMAIIGGSYGGYLTAWLAAHTDRYACAIAHAAVTNLAGMYATDWSLTRAHSYGAEIWEDHDRVMRWSPSAHADGYRTPTLVIHGEKDYRVPVTQGLELYGVLKSKGIDARLLYFDDENHWILKPRNSLRWYEEVHGWLARYLS